MPKGDISTWEKRGHFYFGLTTDATDFKWSEERASVWYSLSNYNGVDEVHLVRNPSIQSWPLNYTIRFIRENKLLLSIKGHRYTVFKVVKDTVYYADYSFISSGCAVVAYDLKAERQLWRTRLQGIGLDLAPEKYAKIQRGFSVI